MWVGVMDTANWLRRMKMTNDLKPGYRTTEFWLVAVTVFVGLLLGSGAIPADSSLARALGLFAAALASMGYSWSRAKAKTE